jgi:hypothetical protein
LNAWFSHHHGPSHPQYRAAQYENVLLQRLCFPSHAAPKNKKFCCVQGK